ncbi:PspC domain-containing protein [Candidatus Bipolaricaulota bacterium]|nr:PspC domain-containing protein [Candidatus Bipolaricaulota bacterium]
MKQRLYRSRSGAILGGVCGGLGDYFNIDSNIIRLVFVILTFINGVGLLLYLAVWLIVPREETTEKTTLKETVYIAAEEIVEKAQSVGKEISTAVRRSSSSNASVFLGIILLLLGSVFLMHNLGLGWFFGLGFNLLWPALLIIGGVVLLLRRRKRD